MSIIKIDRESIFKSKIEAPDTKESVFAECYVKAYKALEDIVFNNKIETNTRNTYEDDDYNNIIGFMGDRGTGKSSTMKSFAISLCSEKLSSDNKILEGINFEVLDIIDPSLFTNKESLVEIIVAKMFNRFKEENNVDLRMKQQLLKKFGQVFQDIKVINANKEQFVRDCNDNIETLIDLASGLSLKDDLKELITLYINYVKKDKKHNSNQFLVIPIDDIDMNIAIGEKLLEEIRKYLIQSNIIVLIAAKYEQLQEIIHQRFIYALKENYQFLNCISRFRENGIEKRPLENFKNDIDDKVEKYLDKLIPYNRRCFMPQFNSNDIVIELDNSFNNIEIENSKCKLWTLIAKNLYKKLNYIIVTEDQFRAIVPSNLRSLIELIVLLNTMKNGDYKKNLFDIRKYYEEVVITKVSNRENMLFLRNLLYCYFNEIKKNSLIYINDRILKDIGESDFNLNDLKSDMGYVKKNKSLISNERISIGDIVTWIKIYETVASTYESRRFIEIFKSIFTIRQLHAYHSDVVDEYDLLGVNLIGKYFYVTNNHNKSKSYINFELVERNSLRKEVCDYIDEDYIEDRIYSFLIQPVFDDKSANNFYARLIRREKKKYIDLEEINDFKKFYYSPFNVFRYNIAATDSIRYILNLDTWCEILEYMDSKIENNHKSTEEVLSNVLGEFNKISFDYQKIEFNYTDKEFNRESIFNIDNRMKNITKLIYSRTEELNSRPEKLKLNNETIKLIKGCIKEIERRCNYIETSEINNRTIKYSIKRIIDDIGNIDIRLPSKYKDKLSDKIYFDRLKEFINRLINLNPELKKENMDVINLVDDLQELNNDLMELLRRSENTI